MFGDDKLTLTIACQEQIEAEANFGAGRLLFLQDEFVSRLADLPVDFKTIETLRKEFGNTLTTTMWRVIEHQTVPAIAIISVHPKHKVKDPEFDPRKPCRYVITSKPFNAQFSGVSDVELFETVRGYCSYSTKGPLGAADVRLTADDGSGHIFHLETFSNTHDVLTLGLYKLPHSIVIAVP